jgi:hypothetical protein
MNLLRTIFFATAVVAALAVTPVALASSPSPAELEASEIRGQALNQACLDPAQSRAAFRALCTFSDTQNQPTPAELKALQTRGQALNQACVDPAHSGAAFGALCTYTGGQIQPTGVEASSSGFDWGDFGIGAGAMLVLALLFGGTAAAVHYGRRSSVQPRTVS